MTGAAAPPSTVILQSYRTERVEPLVALAMATVRQWAALRDYAYVFLDDAFFDVVPLDFRARTGGAIWQMADLALLLQLKRLLETYERAIWIDADFVVLDAAAFHPPVEQSIFFCREYWLSDETATDFSHLDIQGQVNNSICGFGRGEPFLEWFTQETLRVTMRAPDSINWNTTPIATRILTRVHSKTGIPLYEHAGILSPRLYAAMQKPKLARPVWQTYARTAKGIAAVNMTLSLARNGLVSAEGLLKTLGVVWMLNASRPGWPQPAATAKLLDRIE